MTPEKPTEDDFRRDLAGHLSGLEAGGGPGCYEEAVAQSACRRALWAEAEVARLRHACRWCNDTGRVERLECGDASGRPEYAGSDPCPSCSAPSPGGAA